MTELKLFLPQLERAVTELNVASSDIIQTNSVTVRSSCDIIKAVSVTDRESCDGTTELGLFLSQSERAVTELNIILPQLERPVPESKIFLCENQSSASSDLFGVVLGDVSASTLYMHTQHCRSASAEKKKRPNHGCVVRQLSGE